MSERHAAVSLRLPPFTRAMRTLAVVYGVVWGLEVLLQGAPVGPWVGALGVFEPLALVPAAVLQRGHAWQLVTYALLHDPSGAVSLVFSVLALWFMGGALELAWGPRRVLTLMAAAVPAGGVAVVLAGLLDAQIFRGITVGPSAPDAALVAAWCLAHERQSVSVFGVVTLTGRQLLVVALAITLAQLLAARSGAGVASLAGFAVAWAFTRARRDEAPVPREPPRRRGGHLRVVRDDDPKLLN